MVAATSSDNEKRYYMISAVAKRFNVHPQTLRLYERDGLLQPSRTEGNTRLYTDEDLQRLKVILNLTRNLGVNLAGVEIVLNMRENMGRMQEEMNAFIDFFLEQLRNQSGASREEVRKQALARMPQRSIQLFLERMEEEDGGEP